MRAATSVIVRAPLVRAPASCVVASRACARRTSWACASASARASYFSTRVGRRARAVDDDARDAIEDGIDARERALVDALKNHTFDGATYTSTGAFQPTRVDDAKAQIMRFLEYKPRTRRELYDKLVEDKGYDPMDANEALDAVQRCGGQSDSAYAEAFARYKWRQSKWSAWRVRGALRQKGVSDADIDIGFETIFAANGAMKVNLYEDEDEEDDDDEDADLERSRAKELVKSARAQFHRNKRGDFQARINRLIAWLQRRGHGGQVIRDIVTVMKRERDERSDDDDDDDFALRFED